MTAGRRSGGPLSWLTLWQPGEKDGEEKRELVSVLSGHHNYLLMETVLEHVHVVDYRNYSVIYTVVLECSILLRTA